MKKDSPDQIKILGNPEIVSMKEFFMLANEFQIPPYQRQYTWGVRQVKDFWQDIFKTVDFEFSESKLGVTILREHFLGNLFLRTQMGSSAIEIVDGQQRITTSFLMVFTLLNLLNDFSNKNEIDDDYAIEFKRYSEELRRILYPLLNKNKLRLKLGEIDNEYFTNIATITRKGDFDFETPEKDLSTKRIIERNYLIIVQLVEEKLLELDEITKKFYGDGKTSVSIDRLRSIILIIEAILFAIESTLVVTYNYITGDDGDTFLMFEAINARGKPLSQIDTIKNHLFGIAFHGDPNSENNLYEMAKATWKNLIMTHDEKAEDLLYYFFAVEFSTSKITQDRLYEFVVDYIEDSNISPASEVNNILVRLNDYIKVFKLVKHPNAFLFKQIFPNVTNEKLISKINQEIQFINNHEIMMPMVLKVLFDLLRNKIDILSVSTIINSAVNLFIHIQLDENSISKYIDLIPRFAREISNNQEEKSLINTIKDHISKYDNATYQKLIYDLSDRDRIIEKITRSRNESINKLILTKYEISLRGTAEPILDSGVFWLEHIFPKKYSSSVYWQSIFNTYLINELDKGYDESQISKEFFDRYIQNIGNMVVILDTVNTEVGIKPFSEKLTVYRRNDGYSLRELVNGYGEGDFTTESIRDRSLNLAEKIFDSNLLKID